MITGAIAVLIIVVGVIPAFSNGETGAGVLGIVIAAILLFFGMVSRDEASAHVNWVNYWSSSGKDRAMMRHKWNAEARKEERNRQSGTKTYDQVQSERGLQKAGSGWTAGKVEHGDTTYTCPACGNMMNEGHRVEYSSGTIYVTYKCGKCKKELPVKIK